MAGIKIHTAEDFEGMRKAGRLAAETLNYISFHVKEGVSTLQLDNLCHKFILDAGAVPAPLNYYGFPKSICTSINKVVCHGIPNVNDILKNGDIINIDVTVIVDGWHGDTSRMFIIGETSVKAKRLCDVAFNAMLKGIEVAKPGNHFGDIGYAIDTYVKSFKYSVVRDFSGHGIGKVFHDLPNVLNYGEPGIGPELKPGMFFTVEPMVNGGKAKVKILEDKWTVITCDGQLSAQWEHTIGITETGHEIFTLFT